MAKVGCIYTYMDLMHPINCLTFNLQRGARTMSRRLDAALAPLDISAQQFSALAMLSGHESLSTTRLADLTGTERTTITRNMGVLRRRGLVEAAETEDARVNALQLTQAGRSTLLAALPLWREVQEQTIMRLGADNTEQVIALLKGL